jgi:hypothetical protein
MKNGGIFYGHWEHYKNIYYILRPFGYVFPLWYVEPRTIWQPWMSKRFKSDRICEH